MKEILNTDVSAGEVLRIHSSRGPIGRPITVPQGITSVTILIRDTEGFEAARAKREARRNTRLANKPSRSERRKRRLGSDTK